MKKQEMMKLLKENNERQNLNETYYLVEKKVYRKNGGVWEIENTDRVYCMTNDYKEALDAYRTLKGYLNSHEEVVLSKAVDIEPYGVAYYEPIYTYAK